MKLTKEFTLAFNALFLYSVVYALIQLVLFKTTGNFIAIRDSSSTTEIITFHIFRFFSILVFWGAVAYTTKAHRGAMIALVINLLMLSYASYYYISNGISPDTRGLIIWFWYLVGVLSYLAFARSVFTWKKAFLMILAFVILDGIKGVSYLHEFNKFMNTFFDIIRLEDFLEIRYKTAERSYTAVNILGTFIYNLFLPLSFIIFWFFYSKLKSDKSVDFTFRRIYLNQSISKFTYSNLFWTFRLTLIVSVFGVLVFFRRVDLSAIFSSTFGIKWFLSAIEFLPALYILASLYRNFLTTRFVENGKYPSWLYLLLNIPIVNFFAWIVSLFILRTKPQITNPPPFKGTPLLLENKYEQLKKSFVNRDKNLGIKIVMAFFVVIAGLLNLGFSLRLMEQNPILILVFVGSFVLSLVFLGWYFINRYGAYFLYIIIGGFLLMAGFQEESGLSIGTTMGLLNIVVYYVLFHFDQFEIIEEDALPVNIDSADQEE